MENNNMDFQQFCEYIRDNIRHFLPENLSIKDISIQSCTKNNGNVLTGLQISVPGSPLSPVLYLNSAYDSYRNGYSSLDTVMKNTSNLFIRELPRLGPMDFSYFKDFDSVKDSIYCKLINYDSNKELLADVPHKKLEDLAVVYYYKFPQTDVFGNVGNATITIHNSHLEMWDVSVDVLHATAKENIEREPVRFKSIMEYLSHLYGMEGMEMPDFNPEEGYIPMYIASNEDMVHGAAVVLNDKWMAELNEKMDGSFLIFPSSIHEVIILKCDNTLNKAALENYKSLVCEINSSEVSDEEVLSNNVYMYDAERRQIVQAEKMLDRQQELSVDRPPIDAEQAIMQQPSRVAHRGR